MKIAKSQREFIDWLSGFHPESKAVGPAKTAAPWRFVGRLRRQGRISDANAVKKAGWFEKSSNALALALNTGGGDSVTIGRYLRILSSEWKLGPNSAASRP